MHSSAKAQRDETARHQRIERTLAALADLNERLAGPRARITTRVAAHDAANEILDHGAAEDYVTFTITETIEERFRQEKRGRPGNDTRYRKLTKTRFQADTHRRCRRGPPRRRERRLLPADHQRPKTSPTRRSCSPTATSPTSRSATTS